MDREYEFHCATCGWEETECECEGKTRMNSREIAEDIDYAKRLIAGVRKMMEQEMNKDLVRQEYPKAISSTWLDASLLCSVVEEDLIPAHIESLDKLDERDKITKETHRLWKEYKDEAEAKLEEAEKEGDTMRSELEGIRERASLSNDDALVDSINKTLNQYGKDK